ncbi:MAG: YigZ family protein [Bacteroides sp.]|nr:YigZ family protein [Prevotella sp.]MCM1408882.1 YigZ family protein [Treponema brennaborense]MCM1470857.1 YigZ family protein [Bacteroides sp.]
MNTLKAYTSAELTVKNSRFLAEVFPISSQSDARRLLKMQKEKYSGASHVVHAFAAGDNAEILGTSDDGEPSGTAGRPVLDVLKGMCCTNILVTVTRWFGGTLLGTGGLARAYSSAAKAVLGAAVFEPVVKKTAFAFSVPYAFYDQAKRFIESLRVFDAAEHFETDIRFNGFIACADAEKLASYITQLTNGKASVQLSSDN